ncbi:hypothetical protein HUU40_01160 [candidate division KSB1 bacterium]|nr:hypothetical protein [candidate division KSB1 bacterium]
MQQIVPVITTILLLFSGGLLISLTPGEDLISMLPYMIIVAAVPKILYDLAIKPADSGFPLSLFLLAFAIKMLGSVSRLWMLVDVYERGDSMRYHQDGEYWATFFRQFDFSVVGETVSRGTEAMSYLTALLYTIFPPSLQGSFLLFAALAFIGSAFFYKAHRVAYPEIDPKFYRALVFFLPSILFWPSSLGKDAWIFFASGFVAYGVVKFVRHRDLAGVLWLIFGMLLIGLIRPHIAAFVVLSLGLAYLVFFLRNTHSPHQVLAPLIGGSILVGLGIYTFQTSLEFMVQKGLAGASWDAVEQYFYAKQQTHYGGGSGYAPNVVLGIAGFIPAILAILMRPFIWEAHNPQALMSALESILWAGILWHQRKIFWQRLRNLTADPLVSFALVYSIVMILSIATLGNLGLIARQRVQLLPFFFFLFA